eukprot:5440622-Alexandrium_andersonii.AAC.1
MLAEVLAEMATCRNFPMVLCGDFNGALGLYPAIADALAARTLIDVEDVPGIEGQGQCSGTCRAHGAKDFSRIDFMLVNPALAARLKRVDVPEDELYDTHRPVRAWFSFSQKIGA